MPRGSDAIFGALHSERLPALAERAVSCIGILLDEDFAACCQRVRADVDEAEWLRAQRFVQPIDAARHLVGRALVRRVLARELGWTNVARPFSLNPWGKPGLAGSGIEFSISHSGSWVWAAFCRGVSVGIDIEEVKPLNDLAGLVEALHPAESAAIQLLPATEACAAFYRCWTRKEAILKAAGEGLSRPLDSFQVSAAATSGSWLVAVAADRIDRWTTADVTISSENYCCMAVAVRAPEFAVVAHILD